MAARTTSRLRRKSRGSLSAVALLCAAMVASAFLLSRRVEAPKPQPRAVVAQFDTVDVPVPAEFVPPGTKVRDIRFRTVSYPKHQLPSGALLDVGPMLEAVSTSGLPANLPLFKENLSLTALGSNPVVERIPPGMRAMTIKVDATSAVEGWAGSGSIVDVLLVTKDKTSVIAESVKILSAERSVAPVEGQAAPSVPSTVTLLVTQEQCLAINTAIPLGKIAFALRSTKDEEQWEDTIYTAERFNFGANARARARGISGFVSIKEGQSEKAFALSDGKWVKTEVIPEGFLANEEREIKDSGSAGFSPSLKATEDKPAQ